MRAGLLRRFSTITASAALAIVGADASASAGDASIWLHYLFKPLTTVFIFLLAWRVIAPVNPRYRSSILSGMVFCLCGDIFLMLPPEIVRAGFLFGLASFLIAHVFFLSAFGSDTRLFSRPFVVAGCAAFALLNFAILWPYLDDGLRIPVLAYLVVLVAMTSQALIRALELNTASSRLAALGGLSFMLSDTLLAYNKFFTPLPFSALLILSTYYVALSCIACSVEDRG